MSVIRERPSNTQLDCGHGAIFDPAPFIGDIVYCHQCRDYSMVASGGMRRIFVTISCEQCAYERNYKNITETVARVRADIHTIKFRHTVSVVGKSGSLVYRSVPRSLSNRYQKYPEIGID